MASRLILACSFRAGSNGSLVPRSATSSRPWNRPRPRTSPTNGMIAEPLLQAARKVGALLADVFEQVVAADHALDGERRRAGEGMAGIGVAVLEGAGALGERLEDLAL